MTDGEYRRLSAGCDFGCAIPKRRNVTWTCDAVLKAIVAASHDGVCDASKLHSSVQAMAARKFGTFVAAAAFVGIKTATTVRQRFAQCSVAECSRKPRSKSSPYCETHYYRLRRNGTLLRLDGHAECQIGDGCLYCGAETGGTRYCTTRCQNRSWRGLPQTIQCAICACTFSPFERNMVCSDECDEKRVRAWMEKARLRDPERYKQRMRDGEYKRKARQRAVAWEPVRRLDIFERDQWICQLCGEPVDRTCTFPHPKFPTIDHVVPLALGGPHIRANLQCAHLRCNVKKGARIVPKATAAQASYAPATDRR